MGQTKRGGEGGIISSKGKGLLRTANPIQSGIPPMNIVGSCETQLVFMPEDPVKRMTVRVVEGLPCGLILGAEFLRQTWERTQLREGRRLQASSRIAMGAAEIDGVVLDAIGKKGNEQESDT